MKNLAIWKIDFENKIIIFTLIDEKQNILSLRNIAFISQRFKNIGVLL